MIWLCSHITNDLVVPAQQAVADTPHMLLRSVQRQPFLHKLGGALAIALGVCRPAEIDKRLGQARVVPGLAIQRQARLYKRGRPRIIVQASGKPPRSVQYSRGLTPWVGELRPDYVPMRLPPTSTLR